MKKRYLSVIAGACFIITSSALQAATANFDSFSEGSVGYSFTDGGITFSDFDNYMSFLNPPFYIEDGSTSLVDSTFSPNNALGFASPVAGGSVAYGRFGSITMSIDSLATSASLDIFAGSTHANTQLTLSAYNQGSFMGSESVWLSAFSHHGSGAHQYTMAIDGFQFDELRLVSDFGEASFILLDNVVFNTPVPVPPAGLLFASGLMWLGARSRKKKSLQTA